MFRLTDLFSRRCCGGPVLAISIVLALLGALFVALAATTPGLVFILAGSGSLGLCLMLGRKRCPASTRHLRLNPGD